MEEPSDEENVDPENRAEANVGARNPAQANVGAQNPEHANVGAQNPAEHPNPAVGRVIATANAGNPLGALRLMVQQLERNPVAVAMEMGPEVVAEANPVAPPEPLEHVQVYPAPPSPPHLLCLDCPNHEHVHRK
jgi:hypothetical protein